MKAIGGRGVRHQKVRDRSDGFRHIASYHGYLIRGEEEVGGLHRGLPYFHESLYQPVVSILYLDYVYHRCPSSLTASLLSHPLNQLRI